MERIREQINIFTPLGIRFWDPATDTQVRDGLVVTARPLTSLSPSRQAFRTASGIYAFQGLPGLRAYEYSDRERQPLRVQFFGLEQQAYDYLPEEASSPPAPQPFEITVQDQRHRFIPFTFQIVLPLTEEGFYTLSVPNSLPEDTPPGFYLFSAPSRTVAPGLGGVRAQLTDAYTGLPAAHAVLEVLVDGAPEPAYYGIADVRGQVAVLLPYPKIITALEGSPPAGGTPLSEQTWPLTIRVRYAPDTISFSEDTELPDLRTVVAQPAGRIHPVPVASPLTTVPVGEWPATLRYSAESVLRTDGRSDLLIEAMTSPP